jgi:tRNA pseudouridine38-40 synthase
MELKTRYFIFISYKGTHYHGWQVQPDSVTVQKVIDEALSTILGENISTVGAGRTDTGVHALFFCAHFDSVAQDLDSSESLLFRLNRYLPNDISVTSLKKVQPDISARFNAISRTYKYYVSRKKDPFFDDSSWFLYGNIDVDAMNKACGLLYEYTDFTSFSRLHSSAKTNICKIYSAAWTEEGNRLEFTIKADRFLRNMVRAIVGTMVEVGFGKIDSEGFRKIILAKERGFAGMSAPAKGLFLTDIEYLPDIFI